MRIQRYFALGFAWLSLAPLALSQNVRSINKVPGGVESTTQRLTHSLEKQGYEVLRGYFKLMTNDDCDLSYKVMHTCYGNNPAAPYVIPIVQQHYKNELGCTSQALHARLRSQRLEGVRHDCYDVDHPVM
jgi:hypothetical protein